jgi:hypothetical protein
VNGLREALQPPHSQTSNPESGKGEGGKGGEGGTSAQDGGKGEQNAGPSNVNKSARERFVGWWYG